ncbi:MAG: hypothetical protein PHC62_01035 [Candidatus Izemoplasmatales bacterium]|nr:hypothetical protein [Candidatus Izemoplasmatales bacterium]
MIEVLETIEVNGSNFLKGNVTAEQLCAHVLDKGRIPKLKTKTNHKFIEVLEIQDAPKGLSSLFLSSKTMIAKGEINSIHQILNGYTNV